MYRVCISEECRAGILKELGGVEKEDMPFTRMLIQALEDLGGGNE